MCIPPGGGWGGFRQEGGSWACHGGVHSPRTGMVWLVVVLWVGGLRGWG